MSKCITISDDAYDSLKSLKKDNESFSEIIRDLTGKRKGSNLLKLAGVWKDEPDTVNTMKSVYEGRKNIRLRQ